MRDAVQEFKEFNRPFARRNAALMRFKIQRMAAGPLAFFRGTFHQFARDIVDGLVDYSTREDSAELDIIGDIHSENYGAFKAEDGLVHYDVNDFDETTRGPLSLDVCRLATSLFLAARERGGSLAEAASSVLAGMGAYAEHLQIALKKGKPFVFDVSEAQGADCAAVDDLISAGAARRRTEFIANMTEADGGGRRLHRSTAYFNLPDAERQRVERLLADYRTRLTSEPSRPDYYAIEDVCGRVSGVGSMGRYRYAVLIRGKSSADARNILLEFKEARASGYDLARGRASAPASSATRAAAVIAMQRQSQAACNGHLGLAVDGDLSFQVREIGPHDGRVDTKSLKTAAELDCVALVQGEILARIHARAARKTIGPANPLADVDDADRFCQRVLSFALRYADVVKQDFDRFVGVRTELDDVASWAGAVSASASGT